MLVDEDVVEQVECNNGKIVGEDGFRTLEQLRHQVLMYSPALTKAFQ